MIQNKQSNYSNSTSSNSPLKEDIQTEMAKVTKEIYERNVELAIRNQTLSTLRKMYEIMNSSFGVEETAQKLIEAIVGELGFAKAFIALIDNKEKVLKTLALSPSNDKEQEILNTFGRPIKNFVVPLSLKDNYCIKCIDQNHPRMTNNLYDVIMPMIDETASEKLAEALDIKTTVIFPLKFANETLGVLTICMDKHIGNLSHAELDTIRELIEVVSIAIERAQIYHELQIANENLKQMDKLKDDFISFTSHELRTPLTAVKSYVWMVLNGKTGNLTEKAVLYLNRVLEASERLISLVNDMLNVSRIESGRIEITVESFDACLIINEIIDEFQAKAQELKISLSKEYSQNPIMVSADKGKIHEVLENLVGNALKFTPKEGCVTVSCNPKENKTEFCVRDTGIGIKPEDVSKLFTKFGRIDNSYNYISISTGTGLGLFISKQYVELCKGKIWIESEPNKGSAFKFTLPNG
jgi:signal transduction histidine kinase